jgi:hypothetical protein
MSSFVKTAAAALLGLSTVALSGNGASAAPIVSTAGVALVGVQSSTASIGLGTIFTNTIFSLVSQTTNAFSVLPFPTFLTTAPVRATVGTALGFTASFGNFTGTVTGAALTGTTRNRTVTVTGTGTFTPSPTGLLNAYLPGAMNFTFAANQTGGPRSAVSASYTVSWEAQRRQVPEPTTLALFGAGLLGLGLARRRRSVR